jgi:hypothetical protein
MRRTTSRIRDLQMRVAMQMEEGGMRGDRRFPR